MDKGAANRQNAQSERGIGLVDGSCSEWFPTFRVSDCWLKSNEPGEPLAARSDQTRHARADGGEAMSESVEGTSPAALDRSTNGGSSLSVSRTETLRGARRVGSGPCGFGAMNPADFLERLCNDQVRRWRAGQRVPAETYLALYPNVEDAGEAAFELIYGEFLLREELGEPPLPEEFRWRFPQFAARLAAAARPARGIQRRERYGPELSAIGAAASDASRGRRCAIDRAGLQRSWASWAEAAWVLSTRPGKRV